METIIIIGSFILVTKKITGVTVELNDVIFSVLWFGWQEILVVCSHFLPESVFLLIPVSNFVGCCVCHLVELEHHHVP